MTSTDERAFIDGILEQPESDTRRLVYADWLDENAGTEVCPKCKGKGEFRDYHIGTRNKPCLACGGVVLSPHSYQKGTGSIPDGRADRAELIRVQVELSNRACHRFLMSCHEAGQSRCICMDSGKYDAMFARESALLKAHPEWFPVCPVCLGVPNCRQVVDGQERTGICSGTGRIGTFTRGLLESVTVPTLETVLITCPDCTDGRWRNGSDGICRTCENGKHCVCPWAYALVRDRERWPALREVRIEGLRLYHNGSDGWQVDGVPLLAEEVTASGLSWKTNEPERAKALGAAVWWVLLKLAGVEQ